MDTGALMKWVKFVSFGFVLLGGLNWLLIGLFEFDLIGGIFGGGDSVVSRIIFSLVGIAAVTLLAIVLVKAFKKDKAAPKTTAAKSE